MQKEGDNQFSPEELEELEKTISPSSRTTADAEFQASCRQQQGPCLNEYYGDEQVLIDDGEFVTEEEILAGPDGGPALPSAAVAPISRSEMIQRGLDPDAHYYDISGKLLYKPESTWHTHLFP